MINNEKRAYFISVPKTGTSSMMRVLAQHGFRSLQHTKKHLRYSEYNNYVTEHKQPLNNYFSFCFVRNTWDRLVSEFKFQSRYAKFWKDVGGYDLKNMGFNSFVKNVVAANKPFSNHLYPRTKTGGDVSWGQLQFLDAEANKREFKNGVKFVGRYESINRDFAKLLEHLDIPDTPLPRLNISRRKKPYQELYDEESREIVRELYSAEIKEFGFTFNDSLRQS